MTPWRQLYLDDATAIRAKYDIVNRYGLRGAGIWALGYDGTRPELWAAIKDKFITDTKPPEVSIVRLSSGQTSPGFTVKWTGTDDSAIARYDVQVSTNGGTWAGLLTGTTATSAVFPGADGKAYAFRVRATDVKGNTSAWANVTKTAPGTSLAVGGFGSIRVDGLAARSEPAVTASQIGTLSTGNLVAITGGPVTGRWLHLVPDQGRPQGLARPGRDDPLGLGGGQVARRRRSSRRPGDRTRLGPSGRSPA